MLRNVARLIAAALLTGGAAAVAAPSHSDAIHEASDAPGRPKPNHTYKFVFTTDTSEDVALGYNPGLRALATLIAEYIGYGIDPAHRSIVVVLNGKHADMALTDAAYKRLHGGEANPSLPQIEALERQGVVFAVPATDVTALSLQATDIQPSVKIGPRASILFLDLESEGYVYDGLKSLINE